MAQRNPLVLLNGELSELPANDSLVGIPDQRDPLLRSIELRRAVWEAFAAAPYGASYVAVSSLPVSGSFVGAEFNRAGFLFLCRPLDAAGGVAYWLRVDGRLKDSRCFIDASVNGNQLVLLRADNTTRTLTLPAGPAGGTTTGDADDLTGFDYDQTSGQLTLSTSDETYTAYLLNIPYSSLAPALRALLDSLAQRLDGVEQRASGLEAKASNHEGRIVTLENQPAPAAYNDESVRERLRILEALPPGSRLVTLPTPDGKPILVRTGLDYAWKAPVLYVAAKDMNATAAPSAGNWAVYLDTTPGANSLGRPQLVEELRLALAPALPTDPVVVQSQLTYLLAAIVGVRQNNSQPVAYDATPTAEESSLDNYQYTYYQNRYFGANFPLRVANADFDGRGNALYVDSLQLDYATVRNTIAEAEAFYLNGIVENSELTGYLDMGDGNRRVTLRDVIVTQKPYNQPWARGTGIIILEGNTVVPDDIQAKPESTIRIVDRRPAAAGGPGGYYLPDGKKEQVISLFTSATQFSAEDVALEGDNQFDYLGTGFIVKDTKTKYECTAEVTTLPPRVAAKRVVRTWVRYNYNTDASGSYTDAQAVAAVSTILGYQFGGVFSEGVDDNDFPNGYKKNFWYIARTQGIICLCKKDTYKRGGSTTDTDQWAFLYRFPTSSGGSYTLTPATTKALGGLIVGSGLEVNGDGVVNVLAGRYVAQDVVYATLNQALGAVTYGVIHIEKFQTTYATALTLPSNISLNANFNTLQFLGSGSGASVTSEYSLVMLNNTAIYNALLSTTRLNNVYAKSSYTQAKPEVETTSNRLIKGGKFAGNITVERNAFVQLDSVQCTSTRFLAADAGPAGYPATIILLGSTTVEFFDFGPNPGITVIDRRPVLTNTTTTY